MEVTNNSKAPQGLHTLTGTVFVQPGETKTVRLNETLASHAKRLDFFSLEGDPEEDDLGKADAPQGSFVQADQMDALKSKFEEQEAEIGRLASENNDLRTDLHNRDQKVAALEAEVERIKALPAPTAKPDVEGIFTVKEKSPGWFVVIKDGAEVTKSLRKDDLAEFQTMNDGDRAAFVDLNKPA